MNIAQLSVTETLGSRRFASSSRFVRAFNIARRYVKTRQRHAMLRGLIPPARLNQDLAELLSQSDVPRRAVD